MRADLVQIVFFLLAFVLAAAAQDLAPVLAGVKPPFLAAVFLYVALTRHSSASILAALAAGGLVDALSGLPAFCTPCFLLVVHVLARTAGRAMRTLPGAVAGGLGLLAVAPCGELWIRVWTGDPFLTSPLARLPAAALLGALTGAAVFAVLGRLESAAAARAVNDGEGAVS